MEQSIASLSPEQAQRALMIFYDLLPDGFWEGGQMMWEASGKRFFMLARGVSSSLSLMSTRKQRNAWGGRSTATG